MRKPANHNKSGGESRPSPLRLLAACIVAAVSCAHDSTAPIVATQLVFTTQPVGAVAGANFSPAIVVTAKDAGGNLVPSFTGDVTVAFGTNVNAGTLSGTVTVAAIDGVATFNNISLNRVGIDYTLVASSGALTPATSAEFNITAGVATQLVVTGQPSTAVEGVPITPTIIVTAQDASGNVATAYTGPVTLAFGANPGGSTLSGTTTAAAIAGVATFNNISLTKATSGYTLIASATALTAATSAAFTVVGGAATQLVFAQQPVNTVVGASISPAIVVTAQDANGNVATAYTGAVTLALGANPGGSTLSGTTTVAAVAGVATFNNISLNKASAGYTLTASSSALTPATSAAFTIAGPATQLVVSQLPASAAAGTAITPAITVTARDANGNVAMGYIGAVTLAFGANPGGSTLSGTVTVAAVAGVATFSNISLNKAGTGYTLVASSGAFTPATSAAFSITAAAAATLAKSGGDLQTVAGATVLATPLSVTATDAFSNVVAGATVQWSAVTGGGSMGVPTSVTNALGVATSTWTLGATAGSQTASATIAGLPASAVTFTATATALTFTSLTGGVYHTCGATAGGTAYCWGDNINNQLGDGTTIERLNPTPVAGGVAFASITARAYGACGLTAGGAAYCWGDNGNGQLGDGTNTQRATPVAVQGGLVFTSLTAGVYHTCGLTAGGAAYCWGDNTLGQLGDGTNATRLTPTPVAGGLAFASLVSGQYYGCGLTAGGAAYCWGDNNFAELGNGTANGSNFTPVAVQGGLVFASVTAGARTTCALTASGAAYCWRDNTYGQLADGTNIQRLSPVAISGGLAFTSLTAGAGNICGLVSGGAAYCWGDNDFGELGDGTTTQRIAPVAVQGGLVFTSLTAGYSHPCGLISGGAAYCWGYNGVGGLGDGTTTNRSVPTAVVP
jgi:alpha-tubulin suppressor-like RCC1 family protein